MAATRSIHCRADRGVEGVVQKGVRIDPQIAERLRAMGYLRWRVMDPAPTTWPVSPRADADVVVAWLIS